MKKWNFFLIYWNTMPIIKKATGDVLREWDDYNVTQKIYDGYWEYHTERIENAFEDIDSLIAIGKHAW